MFTPWFLGIRGFFRRYLFAGKREHSTANSDKRRGNDSIWAVVAGVVKGFNLTFDYVLSMSYANMILYSSVLPSYEDMKEDKPKSSKKLPEKLETVEDFEAFIN